MAVIVEFTVDGSDGVMRFVVHLQRISFFMHTPNCSVIKPNVCAQSCGCKIKGRPWP